MWVLTWVDPTQQCFNTAQMVAYTTTLAGIIRTLRMTYLFWNLFYVVVSVAQIVRIKW
eukprot:m.470784 g.470784  ORF g.470784 m.470784 type:complete len:58 (+) comp21654_c1_seq6:1484-1657(+)